MKLVFRILVFVIMLLLITFGYFYMNQSRSCYLNYEKGNNMTYPVQIGWGYGELKWGCDNLIPVYDKGWLAR